MSTMHGYGEVRFSDMFADTVRTHGVVWSWGYYASHGMPAWEFDFWMAACGFGV